MAWGLGLGFLGLVFGWRAWMIFLLLVYGFEAVDGYLCIDLSVFRRMREEFISSLSL